MCLTGKTTLGSSRASVPPDILLCGNGIDDYHGYIVVDGNQVVTLYPLAILTLINGERLTKPTVLDHGKTHCLAELDTFQPV